MGSQLADILNLVSRTAEKGGDLHSFVRGDADHAAEVYAFIDSLRQVADLPVPAPRLASTIRGREVLLAALSTGTEVALARPGLGARAWGLATGLWSLLPVGHSRRALSRS